jgi:hypothetical protein
MTTRLDFVIGLLLEPAEQGPGDLGESAERDEEDHQEPDEN